MANVGYATLQVIPSMKGVAGALTGEAKTAGGAAGTAGGSAFMGGMGGAMKALAPAAIVAGIGVGLFKIGENFDAAFDKIRTGTGATGKELEGLKDSFKTVIQDVPADFGDAASAIAEVNARLGLTGKPLEDVTGQLLNLSRITETDLMTNIESTTRLFGDWGIATENQSGTLDKLFRASQESGIGVSELSENMVKFGAPLRQIGFDFDTSAAMFANFEAEGVNVSKMMPGLNIALKKFAESGREPGQAFRETVEAIKTLPPEQAKMLAQQTFGTRAGLEWAAAIREGRFEFSDLKDEIVNGTDTINQASEDTEDFAEKWKKFSSTLQVAIEPLASAVFDALGDAMDQAAEFGSKFIDEIRFSFAAGGWEGVGQLLQDKFAALLENIIFKDQIIALVEGVFAILKTMFLAFFDTLRGLWDTFAGLFTGDWGRMWNGLVTLFQVPWNLIVGLLGAFGGMMISILAGVWDLIKMGAVAAWQAIVAAIQAIWNALPGWLQTTLAAIGAIFVIAWAVIAAVVTTAMALITATIQIGWAVITTVVSTAMSIISAVIQIAWAVIQAIITTAMAVITAVIQIAWAVITTVVSTAMSLISAVIQLAWAVIQAIISTAMAAIQAVIQVAWAVIQSVIEGACTVAGAAVSVLTGIIDTAKGAMQAIADVASWVWSAIGTAVEKGAEIAGAALGPLIDAFNTVKDAVSDVLGVLESAIGAIADFFTSAGKFPGGAGALGNLGKPQFTGGGLVLGGGGNTAGNSAPRGFRFGGRPPVGLPSIVGENGPELFWPDHAGTIIPNHELSGSSTGDWDSAANDELRALRLEVRRMRLNQERVVDVAPSRAHAARR